MTPSIHDVVGSPLPGSGMKPIPKPVSGIDFRAILDQLLHQGGAGGVRAPRLRQVTPSAHAAPVPVGRTIPASTGTLCAGPSWRGGAAPHPAAHAGGARKPTPAAREALKGSIRRAATHAGVAPDLSVAIARAESSLDPRAVSPDGISVGTFQVTHATKAEMRRKFASGIVERPPGSDDVALGVGYLRYLGDAFAHDTGLGGGLETRGIRDPRERRRFVAAAYNAGEGRVAAAQAQAEARGLDPTRFASVKPFLPRITQGYVDRVQTYAREESATDIAG